MNMHYKTNFHLQFYHIESLDTAGMHILSLYTFGHSILSNFHTFIHMVMLMNDCHPMNVPIEYHHIIMSHVVFFNGHKQEVTCDSDSPSVVVFMWADARLFPRPQQIP